MHTAVPPYGDNALVQRKSMFGWRGTIEPWSASFGRIAQQCEL
jgi:hypothetical protein